MITIKCPTHHDIAEKILKAINDFKSGKIAFYSREESEGCPKLNTPVNVKIRTEPSMILMSRSVYDKFLYDVEYNNYLKFSYLLEEIDDKEYFNKIQIIIGHGLNPIDIHII